MGEVEQAEGKFNFDRNYLFLLFVCFFCTRKKLKAAYTTV